MIGIVMLNYNEWDLTIDSILSIRKHCKYSYKVYLIDNCSAVKMTDSFRKFIADSDDCELIFNKKNSGYAAGNNLGIKRALDDNVDYILITNNDVIFKDNSIEELANFLSNNPEYGIAGPKVYLPNGDIQEINMGCKMTMLGKYLYLLRKTPLWRLSKHFVRKFHVEDKDLSMPFDIFAVSGCCFMMSLNATRKLYPLDENTFLFEEENIIGTCMEKNNLKTVYDINSQIIHLGGASTQGMSEFAYGCFINSEQYYCKAYLQAGIVQRGPLLLIRLVTYCNKYGLSKGIKFLKTKYNV